MKNRLYPMGPGAILDNTFFILRDRFWKFQGVIFLSYLPVIIISLLLFILFVPTLMNATDIFTGLELGKRRFLRFSHPWGDILSFYSFP